MIACKNAANNAAKRERYGSLMEIRKNGKMRKKKYEITNGDHEREISLSIGFGELRERLGERDEDRQRMQRPHGRKQGNVNGNYPISFRKWEFRRQNRQLR